MTTFHRATRAAVVFLAWASVASAQSHYGIRAGVSGDPTQFVFGGHIETKPLMPHLTFRPNLEVGVGDHATLVAINLEFAYKIKLDKHPWTVYLGGGPAAVIRSEHQDSPASPGDTDFGGGFNFLIGAQHNGGLFTEFKVGLIDSPGVKFMVGYAFR